MRHIFFGALILCSQSAVALGPEWVGRTLPDCSLRTIDGKRAVSLQSFKGSVLMIDFWATWCPPCQRTLPALSSLEAATPGLKVVAVNIDDDRSRAEGFLRNHGLHLLVLYDEGKRLAQSYDVSGMPSALIVDQDGIVRFVHTGYTERDLDDIKKEIATMEERRTHD